MKFHYRRKFHVRQRQDTQKSEHNRLVISQAYQHHLIQYADHSDHYGPNHIIGYRDSVIDKKVGRRFGVFGRKPQVKSIRSDGLRIITTY